MARARESIEEALCGESCENSVRIDSSRVGVSDKTGLDRGGKTLGPRAILQEIARVDAALADSGRQRDELRAALESLRAELGVPNPPLLSSAPPIAMPDAKAPHTPADKVRLFRSLFRGRADIFPVRFVSNKTNRPGYAPACSNKWQPGLCLLKTGGKCSDCLNQATPAVRPSTAREDPICAALRPVQSVAAGNTRIWHLIHCSISILGARTAALPASWRTRWLNRERPSRSRSSNARLP